MKNWLSLFAGLALILALTACSDESPNVNVPDDASAKKVSKFDPLTVACGVASKSTLTVTVTAGASGAPAGFSLQWMTAADYGAYGWNEEYMCKGSFSGNANSSRYNLGSNESVELTIGDLMYDNGASTSCADFLECGTEYVFRTFAHATRSMFRSDYSENYSCTTADCEGNCTYGLGFWKNNPDAWPVDELTLGNVVYSKNDLLAILDASPNPGNAFIILAHHLIAAKLNVANEAVINGGVEDAIDDADALIGSTDILTSTVHVSSTEGQQANTIKNILEDYNNGNSCQ